MYIVVRKQLHSAADMKLTTVLSQDVAMLVSYMSVQ